MKKLLVFLLAVCFFSTTASAAVRSVAEEQEKEEATPTVQPVVKPTKTLLPTASPTKPVTRTVPKDSTKVRAPALVSPEISPLTRPVTSTPVTQPTQNPIGPVIDSISFNGHDPTGNLKWTATVRNALSTNYNLPLWVAGKQCRTIQAGLQCDFVGNNLVTPQNLAAGQSVQVSGSFPRFAGYTLFKTRLKNGPTTIHEREVPLPPELSYQAQIVNININSAINNVEVQVQNTGANAIPILSVQKLCASASAPGSFIACGGNALNNILPNQMATASSPIPTGWPSDPSIMKIKVTRGITVLDEEIYNAP